MDVQCTLDGSIRHILKFNKLGWKEWSIDTEDRIILTQKNVILNGFRLLKPGGIMVYSTCSLSRRQNEDVVTFLLEQVFKCLALL